MTKNKRQQWEFIRVVRLPAKVRRGHPSETGKTRIFDIYLTDGKTFVGQVKWHNKQRRYVFISKRGPETIPKSAAILADISRFINILMQERENGIK